MDHSVPAIRKKKAYLHIVDVVMNMIAEGKVSYDDSFYTEQELMSMLGVSRPTLREALRVLEFLGVASVTPHKGISINRPEDQGGYLPLLYILSFEKTTGRELFELRQALQLEMTSLAAQRRNKDDLSALWDLVTQMEAKRNGSVEEFSALDYAFHQKIVEISENRLVGKLMETISPTIQYQLAEHIQNETMEHRDQTLNDHRKIVSCLEKGDSQAARQAMYDHLTDSRRDAQRDCVIKF